jgi:malonyl-CoA decarboxylase
VFAGTLTLSATELTSAPDFLKFHTMNTSSTPLWDRTLRRIRRIWPLGDSGKLKNLIDTNLPEGDLQLLRNKIDACLQGQGGEVSARARAAELGETYLVLNSEGRRHFLELLAREYDVDNDAVEEAISRRRESVDANEYQQYTLELRNLLEPPRTKLLRQFNELEEGVKFLVDLRAELIAWAHENPDLRPLDADVFRLLTSWFDVGFLDLQRITWRTPASLLEKLIDYEAVHAILSWKDLKNRLGDDKRGYAYFHPRMPDEPLIFVEVALVSGISNNIHDLLDEKAPAGNPEKADTAIFYSISNCQAGLSGVSFGNFLIKRVVRDLVSKLPNLKTFSTLSPIPGFMQWLKKNPDGVSFTEPELSALNMLNDEGTTELSFFNVLKDTGNPQAKDIRKSLESVLMGLCARYLLTAKKGKRTLDRVAHFHLSNGARIERINWAADLSTNGISQSAGIMVNYLYSLPDIEKNHEAYTGQGEITTSSAVRKLLKNSSRR